MVDNYTPKDVDRETIITVNDVVSCINNLTGIRDMDSYP